MEDVWDKDLYATAKLAGKTPDVMKNHQSVGHCGEQDSEHQDAGLLVVNV